MNRLASRGAAAMTVALACFSFAPSTFAQCVGPQLFFDNTWHDGSYTVNGVTPQWFFPHWSNQFDVACINSPTDIPAIWHNSCPIGCRRLEFTIKGRGLDNDSIGFVLGFCEGTETDPNADYLAVIWNGTEETALLPNSCAPAGTRPKGLRLVRVRGIPDPQEFWSQTTLDLPCSDLNSGVMPLATAITRGNMSWPMDRPVDIVVEVRETRLQVWVEGTLEFDVTIDLTPYLDGCFGYYNQGQFADYWGLRVAALDPVEAVAENYGDGLAGCDGVPSLEMQNLPIIGTSPRIEVGNLGNTTRAGALIWGLAPDNMFIPLLGGSLLIAQPFAAVQPIDIPPGGFLFECQILDNSCQNGVEFYLQAACIDPCGPNGFALSRGLRIVLGDDD